MTPDIEALAQQLELHPDYKVLRRLTHTSVFNPALRGNQLCRGVVLDTETTGFDPQHDKVIELGMLLFDFDPLTGEIHKVLDVFDELEDPGFPIPPATIAVHHITDDMVHHIVCDVVNSDGCWWNRKTRVFEFVKNIQDFVNFSRQRVEIE